MKEIRITWTQEFFGKNIPVIEGGFSEEQRIMTVQQIAVLHDMKSFEINRLITENEKEFEEGIDILNLLKVGNTHAEINNLFDSNIPYNTKNFFILSASGFSKLFSIKKNRSKVGEILEKYFKTSTNIQMKFARKELRFLSNLKGALKVFNYEYKEQFQVLKYRIDLYIPELKIAIEYDENDHIGYSFEDQEEREEKIKKELKCEFIRLSDKRNDGENIAIVIKSIQNIEHVKKN